MHRLLIRFCEAQGETKGIKDFLSVLMLYGDHPADEIEAAVDLALENGLSSSEAVHHLLIYTDDTGADIAPLDNWSSLPPPDIAAYGQLGGVI